MLSLLNIEMDPRIGCMVLALRTWDPAAIDPDRCFEIAKQNEKCVENINKRTKFVSKTKNSYQLPLQVRPVSLLCLRRVPRCFLRPTYFPTSIESVRNFPTQPFAFPFDLAE